MYLHVLGLREFVIKVKEMMSAMTHFAFLVETILLKRHFAVVTATVGVVNVPAKSSKFSPTVNLVLWVSSF